MADVVKINGYDIKDVTARESASAKYSLPTTGIPSSDMSEDVKNSLSKADSALQAHQTLQNLGVGYGTCSTSASTTAKVVSMSNYVLTTGGYVTVYFSNNVPANATMNINSKGAKAIRYHGSAITAGVINAGNRATFIYDGTYYALLSVDQEVYSLTDAEVSDFNTRLNIT